MDPKILKNFIKLIEDLQDRRNAVKALKQMLSSYSKTEIVQGLLTLFKDDKSVPRGDALVALLNLIPLPQFRTPQILKHLDGAKGLQLQGTQWAVNGSAGDKMKYPTLENLLGRTVVKADEGTTPRVYVGTYAKYNEGSIAGKWLDLEDYSDADEFYEACKELHKDEADPEFMFQDYEGFPEKFYGESGLNDNIWAWLKLNEEDRELLEVYADDVMGDGSATIEQAREAYQGTFDSKAAWAESYADDTGGLSPQTIARYLSVDDDTAYQIGREEADSAVGDMDDEQILSEAEMQDEYDEAEGEETKAAILSKARDELLDKKADEVEEKIKKDAIGYFVDELGAYSIADLAKADFVRIDYDSFARDCAMDGMTFVDKGRKVWVFNQT